MRIRCARAASKHRIKRDQIWYVIQHCGMAFRQRAPAGATSASDDRLIYLGDDEEGEALEVMAVELNGDTLLVIHAMPLREKYRRHYQEAKKWRI